MNKTALPEKNVQSALKKMLGLTFLLLMGASLGTGCARNKAPRFEENQIPSSVVLQAEAGRAPVVNPISDGAEGFNRTMWGFNRGAIAVFFRPLATGWRWITNEPVRRRTEKVGYNLAFPTRFFATMLEGKFVGSLQELGRFLINTTVGVVGIWDPASKMGFPKHDEDFGQAFGTWGINPGGYLHWPLGGPSSGRDAVGGIFDMATDLATYLFGARTLFRINEFTFQMDAYDKLLKSEYDPYAITRDLWAIDRQYRVADYTPSDQGDGTVEPTFGALFFEPKDKRFFRKAKERRVFIEAAGSKLPYSVWMQERPAPLVYVLPGVGSHRLTNTALALAELLYDDGFSVAIVSSALNWEFLENASLADVPGYPPADAAEVYHALSRIHDDLERKYPNRVTARALMGMSLGALHTLWIAADQRYRAADDFRFDRFVALEPPTNVPYALEQLDRLYDAPMQWPEAERVGRMQNTMLKAAYLLDNRPKPGDALPLSRIETDYLIGLGFRYILRDTIYRSNARSRVPGLPHGFEFTRQESIYDRIMRYSYMDYFNGFVVPYYEKSAAYLLTREQLVENASIWSVGTNLAANQKVRVFANRDDFIFPEGDVDRLKGLLGERVKVYDRGGHLGNLIDPEVQREILGTIGDLK